jgi:hypothetical protein
MNNQTDEESKWEGELVSQVTILLMVVLCA